jgi:Zn-dependent protease with chaperone function
MEFMSTHPSNANRIANMKKVLVEAMEYYRE